MTHIPRRAANRDANEPRVVEALRAAGWGVHQVNDAGFPDLVVARGMRVLLIEVIGKAKDAKYRRNGGLTDVQAEFHRSWPGRIYCVRSAEEALAVVREQ